LGVGGVCCLGLLEGMVRTLLSRLLHPRSGRRGTWNRNDPYVARSRDQEFVSIGPFVLKRHSRCNMTDESFDRLGVMAHNANYRCARDGEETNRSHFPGGAQHKFDGVYVVFGSEHQGKWDRALCHYDSSKPRIL